MGVYVSILYEWIWSSLGSQDRESKLTYKLEQIITGKRKFPQASIHGCAKVQGEMQHGILKLVEREWGRLALKRGIPAKNAWRVSLVKLNALIILRETRCYDVSLILPGTVVSNILVTGLVKSRTSYFRLFRELHEVAGYHVGEHKYRIYSLLWRLR